MIDLAKDGRELVFDRRSEWERNKRRRMEGKEGKSDQPCASQKQRQRE